MLDAWKETAFLTSTNSNISQTQFNEMSRKLVELDSVAHTIVYNAEYA